MSTVGIEPTKPHESKCPLQDSNLRLEGFKASASASWAKRTCDIALGSTSYLFAHGSWDRGVAGYREGCSSGSHLDDGPVAQSVSPATPQVRMTHTVLYGAHPG